MGALPPFSLSWVQWLVRASWQGSVLILLIVAMQWAFGRRMSAWWRHTLWLLVVARLVLPALPESAMSVFNLAPAANSTLIARPVRVAAPLLLTQPALQELGASRAGETRPILASAGTGAQAGAKPMQARLVLSEQAASVVNGGGWRAQLRSAGWWLAALWVAGVAVLSARVLAETLRLRRSVVPRRLVTDTAALELLEDCKQLLGVRVPIVLVQTDRVATPVLFGFVRPRLLVPEGLLEKFTRDELRFVFLHELAHIQRRDIALSWVMAVIQVLHWFNPLVWIAFARMRADRELACDALVLSHTPPGDHKCYGRTMLRLLEGFEPRRPLPPVAGILEDASELKTRIRCIAAFDGRTPSPVVAVAVVVLLGVLTLTDQRMAATPAGATPWPAHFIASGENGVTDIRPVSVRAEPRVDLPAALRHGGVRLGAPSESARLFREGYVRIGAVEGLSADHWLRGSAEGGPSPRTAHSIVWTGRELIVWGGGARNMFKQSGARYNPVTDSWRPVSTNGAPSTRWHHAAVWTGTEMIVWGGRANFFAVDHRGDGALYNPATDTWRPMTMRGAPPARSQMVAVWTGREMIVWGGRGDGHPSSTQKDEYQIFNNGARYDPASDTWTPVSECELERRFGATALWTGDEMIVWGGWTREGKGDARSFNTGARYSPGQNRWTALPIENAPAGRARHTAIWTGTEMLVWGGVTYPKAEFLNDGARWNLATGRWTALSMRGAPEKRSSHLAAWTGSEMVVWGGVAKSDQCVNTGGRYVPASDEWLPIVMGNAPAPRFLMRPDSAVWTGQEMLFFGGYDMVTEFGSVHRWSPPQAMQLYQPKG